MFGQSIVAGAGSRSRLPPMHVAAHLCLLGFGARPLFQPPAFCDPTRKQGNRELVLESGCRLPVKNRLHTRDMCEGNVHGEVFLRFDVKRYERFAGTPFSDQALGSKRPARTVSGCLCTGNHESYHY